jgi:hypothetical protein
MLKIGWYDQNRSWVSFGDVFHKVAQVAHNPSTSDRQPFEFQSQKNAKNHTLSVLFRLFF